MRPQVVCRCTAIRNALPLSMIASLFSSFDRMDGGRADLLICTATHSARHTPLHWEELLFSVRVFSAARGPGRQSRSTGSRDILGYCHICMVTHSKEWKVDGACWRQ